MAIVKLRFVKHMKNLVRYVVGEKEPDDPMTAHNCDQTDPINDLAAMADFYPGKGSITALHLVQSWNATESKTLAASEFHAMGRELVEAKFPGHPYVVVTHTDTGKVHNHIVVSPWHTETGKKIENKRHHLYELRSISDSLCQARGLSVIDGAAKARQARLPEVVQTIARYNGRSWLLDLCQKADFARAYATSYDQYVSILGNFGVVARVEDKNISYFYGGRERGKRGSKLGRLYDKSGLEDAFKSNDERFAKFPGLHAQVRGIVASVADHKMHPEVARAAISSLAGTTFEPGHRDYSKYTKVSRPGRPQRFAHESDVISQVLPIEEIRNARHTNILQYCRDNRIAIETSNDGRRVLKGRPFVELNDYEWVNKKNRTKGSLIELVAAHKQISFLQAIAEINGNPRLLLLEQHLGEVKRPFTSFYVPKEQRLKEPEATAKIAAMLSYYGVDSRHATSLYQQEQVQVDHRGKIRIFAREDQGGALEYVEGSDKSWTRTKVGSFKAAFFAATNGKRKATIYIDPFSFLKQHGPHALRASAHNDGVICFMEADESLLLQHLAKNRHLRELQVFTGSPGAVGRFETEILASLRTKMTQLGVQIGECKGQTRSKSRSHDLPQL